jgi:hypothetical protein
LGNVGVLCVNGHGKTDKWLLEFILWNTPESKVRRKWRKGVLCFTWTWLLQYFFILFLQCVFSLEDNLCDWLLLKSVMIFMHSLHMHRNALCGCGVCICDLVSGPWIHVFKIILYCFTDFVEVTSESSTKSSWAFHIFSHINSG